MQEIRHIKLQQEKECTCQAEEILIQCEICKDEKENLCKPCLTENCHEKMCPFCIFKQVKQCLQENQDPKCPYCRGQPSSVIEEQYAIQKSQKEEINLHTKNSVLIPIQGLQIQDDEEYSDGMRDLFERVEQTQPQFDLAETEQQVNLPKEAYLIRIFQMKSRNLSHPINFVSRNKKWLKSGIKKQILKRTRSLNTVRKKFNYSHIRGKLNPK